MELAKLKTLSEWSKLRSSIESEVMAFLGSLPKERAELQTKVMDEMQFPGYVRRRVNYFIDDWERIAAWLFIPDGKEELPGILCCHQAVPQGKDEPAGLEGDPGLAYAQHYAELGHVTLAPDCITAGERVSSGLRPYDVTAFAKENPHLSVMGKMLWDHMHAIDVLCELKRVDSARLGVIGHGLGAQNALFMAAFDERVQVCVTSYGLSRLENDLRAEHCVLDDGARCVSKSKDAGKKRGFPFDLVDVLALSAPSPTLLMTPPHDDGAIPNAKSGDKAVEYASKVYKLLGAPNALRHYTQTAGRRMSPEALQEADEWFERWL